MSILINNIPGKPDLKLICGKIKSITNGTGKAAGTLKTLTLMDDTKVTFWDNQNRQMASRLAAAKAEAGSFISILASFREGRNPNAINFKYNGPWDFSEDTSTLHPNVEGVIADIITNPNETHVLLDNGETISFKNSANGYRFADRFNERKATVGNKISVIKQGDNIQNFALNDKWEISRSINAVIGRVAFIDETKDENKSPRLKLNVSYFSHTNRETGEKVYKNVYCYFDNNKNSNMVESVKQRVKQNSQVAIIGKKNSNAKIETYTGFYFVNIT